MVRNNIDKVKVKGTIDVLVHRHFPALKTKKLFHCCVIVFTLMNMWIIRKIQWNIVSWKSRFLQSFKYRRYYWCRLRARKRSLQRFWNKKRGRISWYVCSKLYIIVGDLFENFWKMCLEIYELDPAYFYPHQAALKETKLKLDLVT